MRGPSTYLPYSWISRKQGVTEQGTPGAEIISLRDGTYGEALPLVSTLEAFLKRPVRLVAGIDSLTGLQIVERGFSRKLAYMKKVALVAISGLHELYYGHGEETAPDDARCINRLVHRSGDTNWSDVLTKALDAKKHWACLVGLRIVTFYDTEAPGPSGYVVTAYEEDTNAGLY